MQNAQLLNEQKVSINGKADLREKLSETKELISSSIYEMSSTIHLLRDELTTTIAEHKALGYEYISFSREVVKYYKAHFDTFKYFAKQIGNLGN
jgi:phage shock protein A